MKTHYIVEVQADSSGKWAGNAIQHPTFEEAKAAGIDLAHRWTLVTAVQVVEVTEGGTRLNAVTVW